MKTDLKTGIRATVRKIEESVRAALSPLEELEQRNNLFRCGSSQMKSIGEDSLLNIRNQNVKRYYRYTDDAQR